MKIRFMKKLTRSEDDKCFIPGGEGERQLHGVCVGEAATWGVYRRGSYMGCV